MKSELVERPKVTDDFLEIDEHHLNLKNSTIRTILASLLLPWPCYCAMLLKSLYCQNNYSWHGCVLRRGSRSGLSRSIHVPRFLLLEKDTKFLFNNLIRPVFANSAAKSIRQTACTAHIDHHRSSDGTTRPLKKQSSRLLLVTQHIFVDRTLYIESLRRFPPPQSTVRCDQVRRDSDLTAV